jgi:hypothetical protein
MCPESPEGNREDRARACYLRTAAAHGFVNAPPWDELAEQTRQMYRDFVSQPEQPQETPGAD